MAHELEIVNGNAQMAYVGDLPWHGLGTKVEHDLTPGDFQKVAGLDWTVEKQPLVTATGLPIKNKEALVRSSDNSVLDVVGTGWNPVQNSEALTFINFLFGQPPGKYPDSTDLLKPSTFRFRNRLLIESKLFPQSSWKALKAHPTGSVQFPA